MLCKKCGDYILKPDPCGCIMYTIVDGENEEHEIWAFGEENAALKYAEKYSVDNGHCLLFDSTVITINKNNYNISAEEDIRYYADRCEEE